MIIDLEEKMRRFDGKIKRTSNNSINSVEGRGSIGGFNDIETARETISDSRLTLKNLEAKRKAICGSCFRNGNGLGNSGATDIPYDCKLPKEIIYEMIILNGSCGDAVVASGDELRMGRSSSYSNPYDDDPSDLKAGVNGKLWNSYTVGKVMRPMLNRLVDQPGDLDHNAQDVNQLVRNGRIPATQIHTKK